MPKVPMIDDEIRMHKPVSPDFVDFRAGIRCAERVYEVETLYKRIAGYELLVQSMEAELESAKADAQRYSSILQNSFGLEVD